MIDDVTIRIDTSEHLVQDGRFTHAIDAAEHVHMWVKRPQDMLLAAPQRVNLNLLDVIRVFLHRLSVNYQFSSQSLLSPFFSLQKSVSQISKISVL